MLVGEAVPEEEILLAVAQSEMFSRRWSEGLERHLPEAVAERVRYSPRAEWTDADRQAVLDAMRAFRPSPLAPLLALDVRWFAASLAASDLPGLGVVATPEFVGLAPDQRLATLVGALDKGRDTPDADFSGGYRRMKNGFQPSKMQGRPGLVAAAKEGPYTIFEGLSRLAVLLSRTHSEKPVPDPLPVYLGVTARMGEWGFLPRPAGTTASTGGGPGP